MEYLIYNFIVFIIVLFFYIHMIFHLKKSNNLEIYKIKDPDKNELEELLDERQPVIIDYNNNISENINNKILLENYSKYDINVCNIQDKDNNLEYYPLSFIKFIKLLKNNESKYISELNSDFLNETNLEKVLKNNDKLIIPIMNILSKYDILLGSNNSYTKLKYNLSYRNYYYLCEGNATIKLTIPNNMKYLNIKKDLENLIYYSDIDLWNEIDNKDIIDKVKTIDIELEKGQLIYIPAYWLYSIKLNNNAILCNMEYKPLMNILAILPEIILSLIQKTNIKIKSVDSII